MRFRSLIRTFVSMEDQFSRTRMLFGDEAIERLAHSCVAVFGIGGVGGYATEVLARSGVGHLELFDNDKVNVTNINRQIVALYSTIGQYKVDVAASRIHDINPDCTVVPHRMFYLPENAEEVDLSQYDYVVDCIDTVQAKLELVRRCHRLGVPIICSMGAANKLDPSAFRVADLSKTSVDPLAKIMRQTLRREGIHHVKVVFSEELPRRPKETHKETTEVSKRRSTPASNAFVPPAAGLILGGEVVKYLAKLE